MMLHHVVADRVHQVRLAEADAAVNEQRVVRARRRFRNRAARRVRKLIRRPDDEGVEGVARNQAAGSLRSAALVHSGADGLVGAAIGSPAARSGAGASLARGSSAAGAVGHEHQFHVRAADVAQRLGEHDRVVLGQPFDE